MRGPRSCIEPGGGFGEWREAKKGEATSRLKERTARNVG